VRTLTNIFLWSPRKKIHRVPIPTSDSLISFASLRTN
jgi:hypothetical protein